MYAAICTYVRRVSVCTYVQIHRHTATAAPRLLAYSLLVQQVRHSWQLCCNICMLVTTSCRRGHVTCTLAPFTEERGINSNHTYLAIPQYVRTVMQGPQLCVVLNDLCGTVYTENTYTYINVWLSAIHDTHTHIPMQTHHTRTHTHTHTHTQTTNLLLSLTPWPSTRSSSSLNCRVQWLRETSQLNKLW